MLESCGMGARVIQGIFKQQIHHDVSGRAHNSTERAHTLINYKAVISHMDKELEERCLLEIGCVTPCNRMPPGSFAGLRAKSKNKCTSWDA